MRKNIVFLLVFLLVFAFTAGITTAQTLSSYLKPDSIKIGEISNFRWSLKVPSGSKIIQKPIIPDSMPSGIEVLARSEVSKSTKKGFDFYKQSLSISAYDSGFFSIPSLNAILLDKDDTINISCDSILLYSTTVPTDTTAAIKDIKDIIEITPKPSYNWIYYLIAGILLAIGLYLLYVFVIKKRKKEPEIEAATWINPAEYALSKLRKMQETRLWFKIAPKDFFTELVDVLRKYLIYAHNIQSEEMISDELLAAINTKDFAETSNLLLKNILQVSDMAKFAKFKPEAGQYEKSIADAISFVEETKPAETNTENNEMDK